MAAKKEIIRLPSRKPNENAPLDVQLQIGGVPLSLNKELLGDKSAKVAALLRKNPEDDLSHLLGEIPTDPQTLELMARFCHGFKITLTAQNVVRVYCLAHHLGMTEEHRPNNLLRTALVYFQHNVLSSWNKSIKALKSAESVFHQAVELGLVDACAEAIINQALDNPLLLGEPAAKKATHEDDYSEGEENNAYRPNVSRRLFDWKSEDLTILSIRLYEPIMREMARRNVHLEYIAASLCQYAKNWVYNSIKGDDDSTAYKRNSMREIIEAVERVLPREKGLISSTSLFEMLQSAISLDASDECRDGLEVRIGKQLDQATVKDLLIPYQGYAKDEKYDTECVKRILRNYYHNYTSSEKSGLIKVAELMEEFLAEVASDIDLKVDTFTSLADLSASVSDETKRHSDGIYRAIGIYLDKHKYLTQWEREQVCNVLDCNKLSPEACQHAAQSAWLPLRLGVQILFAGQLHLRDTITKEIQTSDPGLLKLDKEEEEEEEEAVRASNSGDEVRAEMEKMGNKVLELERECNIMRTEIQKGCCSNKVKNEKLSMWKEMKRKFGCITSTHDCNCHVKKKKVHPR
ncbi:PREDICTED: BTB/POZ domain-containing protein At5g17580-like [Ipomoea nil]|uniref:BTB/POZ domain-containing protein At5g17580-like n=1 Tax=Ipomoea nil TaxID=35883 RepID=UPI0009019351|nr:PREDICTED: BTB/POZ domain-containing protein At5g17580-like [Ipomoea nil]XP_019158747.1 PREDICTED: BTB/POZ domain-containing protein At5g17580-like [Ipomoea nil]